MTSQSQLLRCIREVSSPRAWDVSEKRFSSVYHRVAVERGLGPRLAGKNDLKEQSHPMTGWYLEGVTGWYLELHLDLGGTE